MIRYYLFLLVIFCISTYYSNAQWEDAVRLTNDPAKSFTSASNQKCIASEGENVHIVWFDARNGEYDIFYKRSTDGGLIWEPDLAITTDPGSQGHPSIAVANGIVNVIWDDDRDGKLEIYYKRSTDNGITWEPEIKLTNHEEDSYMPKTKILSSIALDGSNVHVVWEDYRDEQWEIYYKHSTDFGITWESDIRLTNTRFSYFPSVSASEGIVNVVWSDYESTYEDIFSIRSSDDGITWGEVIPLTIADGYSNYPSISVSNSFAVVAWYDARNGGDPQIFYKISTDNGQNWESDQLLTDATGYHKNANVSVSGSNIHFVWREDNGPDIFYKCLKDFGQTWESNVKLTDSKSSTDPFISVSGSAVYVVWQDKRDDINSEIYFKRNPTGNIVSVNEREYYNSEHITIFPNPANEYLFVSGYEGEIKIYNILGNVFWQGEIIENQRMDISGLNPGIYYLKAENSNQVKKIIVI